MYVGDGSTEGDGMLEGFYGKYGSEGSFYVPPKHVQDRAELIELLLPDGLKARDGALYDYHEQWCGLKADKMIAAGWVKK